MNIDYDRHKKILLFIVYAIVAILALYLVFTQVLGVILPFIFAALFAWLINPIVNFFEKLKINRKLASTLVIFLVFTVIISLISVLIAEIYSFGKETINSVLASSGTSLNAEGLETISDELTRIFKIEINLVEIFKNIIVPIAQTSVGFVTSLAKSLPEIFIGSIVFLLSSYFFVADKEKILEFFKSHLPKGAIKYFTQMREISKSSILKYAKSQVIIMSITFVELVIGFTTMMLLSIGDFRYIFPIAFGIALLDAMPVFGTGAVLIPWSLYSVITGDFNLSVALIILYLVLLIVRQFIEPRIVGQSLGLHPLVTLMSMYLGLQVLGIIGMIMFPIIALFIIQLNRSGAFKKLKFK